MMPSAWPRCLLGDSVVCVCVVVRRLLSVADLTYQRNTLSPRGCERRGDGGGTGTFWGI